MRTAIYPGSFDPFTNGHLDVVERAASLFDQVIIAVLHNPDKTPLFGVGERIGMIRKATEHLQGVTVDSFMGLLVDYVKLKEAQAIVRGLRNSADFDMELPMAQMNEVMYPAAVTVFLGARPAVSHLSSSLVKQVVRGSGDVRSMVPAPVWEALRSNHPPAGD